ncbi:MAG: AbrB/MazE/SpoVT family DNA-binding domain-containing protein [candidate division KSB1 bacterium]
MLTQVQKWGNSLAIRIPKAIASDTKIQNGSMVKLALIKGNIVATPVAEEEFTLEKLLSGITAENIHGEHDTGKAVGKEVW